MRERTKTEHKQEKTLREMETLGNSFGKKEESFGSGKNIWHEIKGAFPVGGKITNISSYKGQVIPAGSMCQFDQVKAEITIVKATDVKTTSNAGGSVEPGKVKGLLQFDIPVNSSTTYATGSVVFAGEIYADRLAEAIPAEVLAVLPMIVPIYEKSTE